MDLQVICLSVTLIATLLMIALTEGSLNADVNPQIVPSKNNRDNHQPITMNQQRPQHQGSRFRDKQHVQDKDHIKQHYDGSIDFDHLNYEQMQEEEVSFHYFKIHDTDNDNRLDGLEIMQAMMHNSDFKKDVLKMDDEEEDSEYEEEVKDHHGDEHEVMDEKTIIAIVEQVLKDDDSNGDGYIDFPEFITSQS